MKRAYLIILGSFLWLIGAGTTINLIASVYRAEWFLNAAVPVLLLVFVGLFLWGTGVWAQAKGHPMILGVVLGWLGPIGLLILVCLQDKSLSGEAP